MHDANQLIHDHVVRVFQTLVLDRNDAAARAKVKVQLESDITGSVVTMDPVDPSHPTLLRGALNHDALSHTIHFQRVIAAAAVCLVCGEALEHVKQYGCVAGIPNCVHEGLR